MVSRFWSVLQILLVAVCTAALVQACTGTKARMAPADEVGEKGVPSVASAAPPTPAPTLSPDSAKKGPRAKPHAHSKREDSDNPLGGLEIPDDQSAAHSVPTSAPDSTGPAVFDAVEKRFQTAQAAFVIPEAMVVGKSSHVHFDLSFGKTMEAMVQDLHNELPSETVRTALIRSSPVAQARLTGQSFQITAITAEEQPVSSTTTTWEWEVVPKTRGNHPLHLSIDAVVSGGSDPLKKTVQTFEKQIAVKVSMVAWAGNAIAANWQWLWTTLLVPIAGFIWAKRRKTTNKTTNRNRKPAGDKRK